MAVDQVNTSHSTRKLTQPCTTSIYTEQILEYTINKPLSLYYVGQCHINFPVPLIFGHRKKQCKKCTEAH